MTLYELDPMNPPQAWEDWAVQGSLEWKFFVADLTPVGEPVYRIVRQKRWLPTQRAWLNELIESGWLVEIGGNDELAP